MELNGEKVFSAKYGEGYVVSLINDVIEISFCDGNRKFSFSKCIELNTITFDKADVQRSVALLVQKDKQRAEEIYRNRFSFSSNANDVTVSEKMSREQEIVEKLRKKIIQNESIAFDLIGLYDDKEFEDYLFKSCFSAMKTIINNGGEMQYSERGRALVILAMTFLALKYYDAGNLESFIYEKYVEYNYPQKNTMVAESKDAVISRGFWRAIKNKKTLFDYRKITMYKDPTAYVAVPLVLSVVPHYRMKDLFIFAKDIYKKKLLFSEEIEDSVLYEKINETLDDLKIKKFITDKYDDKKIGDYLLCSYTKCCIQTGKCQDDLVLIIGQCIKIIINYLTLPEDAYSVPPFFREGFKKWTSDFNEKDIFEKNVILSRPVFYLNSRHNIYIKTGRICMDSRFDPNTVNLVIFSNGKEIDRKLINGANDIEYDYKDDIVGGYIINRIDYKMNSSPLENISYSFVVSGQTIYSSKDYLFRTNIFFDGKGNEVKPGYKHEGEIIVITREEQPTDDYDLKKLYSFSNYYIYSAIVDDQTAYEFDDNSYVFYKIEKPEILGYSVPWAFIENEGKKYRIYKKHSFIFRVAAPIEELYYVLDDVKFDFIDNNEDHSISIYAKEHNDYNTYSINIDNLEPGFHSLKIFTYKNDERINNGAFYFVSDSTFKRDYEKLEKGRLFKLKNAFLHEETTLFYENGCFSKTLDLFVPNLGHSKLILHPSDFSYSIDGETWLDRFNLITLCSIPKSVSKIFVCGPEQSRAYFLDENREKKYISLVNESENEYIYSLYLSHLRELSDNGLKETRVYFEIGNRVNFIIFRFVPYVLRDECCFSFDESTKEHSFKIAFNGCEYVYAKIKSLNNDDKVYASKKIKSGDVLTVLESDIDDKVSYLSVSLYMIKGNTLIQKPFDEPFMTFEKYEIPSRIVTFKNKDNPLDAWFEDDYLCFKTEFSGPESIKLQISPTGKLFNDIILLEQIITSGEIIRFDLKTIMFKSFYILLLNSESTADSKWLYHKIIDNDNNPYLGKTFPLIAIKTLKGMTKYQNVEIKIRTIKRIYNDICLMAADVYSNNYLTDTVFLLNVVKIDEKTIEFALCGEIPNHGSGIPKSKPGNEILIVRRS